MEHYGYRCSVCREMDTFNEESLYQRPPVDILKVRLTRLLSQHAIYQLSAGSVILQHTVPCTLKSKHLPISCDYLNMEHCSRSDHWRMCPGFFRINIMVTFLIKPNMPTVLTEFDTSESAQTSETESSFSTLDVTVSEIPEVQNIKVTKVLLPKYTNGSQLRIRRAHHAHQALADGFPSESNSCKGCKLNDSRLPNRIKGRFQAVCDLLFGQNVAYVLLESFYHPLTSQQNVDALHTRRLHGVPVKLEKESKDSPLHDNIKAVKLLCYNPEVHRKTNQEGPNIQISTEYICRLLANKGRHGFRLYFNSYHICCSEYGRQNIKITLALLPKTEGEHFRFCEKNLISLDAASNPFLQLNPALGVVRTCLSLDDQRFKVSIELYVPHDLTIGDAVLVT